MKLPREPRGFTLVELMIAAVILLVLAGAIGGMAIRGQEAQDYAEKQSVVTGAAQDILERIRGDVRSSSRLFGLDDEGRGYLSGIDRSEWPGLGSERLPVITAQGSFDKDLMGEEKTGNVLLFAMHDRTDTFNLAADDDPPELVRIDIHRILAYYLRPDPRGGSTVDAGALDLVGWVSEPFADWSQVEGIADAAKRQALLAHLWAGTNPAEPKLPFPPTRLLWRLGSPFDGAFASVLADGQQEPVAEGFKLAPDQRRSRPSLLGYRWMSVATNRAGAERGIGAFGLVSDAADGFPHGFELQVVGPASARQVLVHLTVTSASGRKLRAWLDLTGIAETRDL